MASAEQPADGGGLAPAEEFSRGDTTDYKYLSARQRDALQAIGVRQAQADDGIAKRRCVRQMLEEFYGGRFGDRTLEDVVGILRSDGLIRQRDLDGSWMGWQLTNDGAEALRAARDRLDSACEVIDA